MKLKCVIFDFDGTLFDSMYLWDTVAESYVRSRGKEPKPTVREEVRALSLLQAAEHLKKEYDLAETPEEIMAGIDRIIEHFYRDEVQPKPGVVPFLKELRAKGVDVCIATATDRYLIEAALRRCGIEVSELMSEDRIPEFEEYVDVVQIGARNMQNFQLLKAVGKMHKPVLLKRGLCNTIEEWIMSAEYIMAGGNEQVILCERGIRTFEKYTRNTLDLSAVPIIHEKTHLPIIVDPSHATGKANLVEPMMIAAVAAGADGLEVEVHYDPRHAWSDGAQCLTPDAFAQAMAKCRQVAWAIGRDM